jgi:hypothetical protein
MNNLILPNIEYKPLGVYSIHAKNINTLPQNDTVIINNKLFVSNDWSTLHTFVEGDISSEIKYTRNIFVYEDESFWFFQRINNNIQLQFKIKLTNVDTDNTLDKLQFKLPKFLSSKYPSKNNNIIIDKDIVTINLDQPLKSGQLYDSSYVLNISYILS